MKSVKGPISVMSMRLTVLCDNVVGPQLGLLGEHGFACFIETPAGNYLFDTGQGLALLNNSRILGKELASVRGVILSHGHFDHAGGLPDALHQTGPVDVFAHPDLFSPRYRSSSTHRRFIGIPHRREHLESLGARFHLRREWAEIGPGVFVTGEIPRRSIMAGGDGGLITLGAGGQELPDPLADDLSLVIDSPRGLILLLGCAHAGLVNIVAQVREKTGKERIHAILGGTHLGFSAEEELEAALRTMEEIGVQKVGASHCTGQAAAARLHSRLGERFFFAHTGAVLEV
jgi:7,8-dihydropterin-6-yl-methyl-4-(beta-D-ribofuranosyl)aminobenzene 5'-phosphate synthase